MLLLFAVIHIFNICFYQIMSCNRINNCFFYPVKPQPTSAFKVPNQMTSSTYNPSSSPTHTAAVMGGTNAEFNIPTTSGGVESPGPGRAASLRRPNRQTSQSPTSNHMNNLSASREDLKNSMVCIPVGRVNSIPIMQVFNGNARNTHSKTYIHVLPLTE